MEMKRYRLTPENARRDICESTTLQTAGMMARVIGRFWASARAPKKTRPAGAAFLNHLKERGLKGVRLIISGACMGLSESAAEFFPDAAWQRCVVRALVP